MLASVQTTNSTDSARRRGGNARRVALCDSQRQCCLGHPEVKPGILEVGILLKTRFALDQYINLRPVKLNPNVETPLKDKGPEHIDFVVVRESTGGIYTGVGGVTQKGTPLEVATRAARTCGDRLADKPPR